MMQFSTPQLEAIEDRGHSLLVSASAGSGKTSVLVERLTRFVLQDHLSLEHILALTFTEDAAAEMKARLKRRLLEAEALLMQLLAAIDKDEDLSLSLSRFMEYETEREKLKELDYLKIGKKKETLSQILPKLDSQKKEDLETIEKIKEILLEEQAYITRQISLLEEASISTIHSFCLSLVQTYYYRLGISYAMSQHIETGLVDEQALHQGYLQAFSQMDPQALARLLLYFEAFGKKEQIEEYIKDFIEVANAQENPLAWMKSAWKKPFNTHFYAFFKDRILALKESYERISQQLDEIEPGAKNRLEMEEEIEKRKAPLKKLLEFLEKQDYPSFYKTFLAAHQAEGPLKNQIGKTKIKDYNDRAKEIEQELVEALYEPEQFLAMDEEMSEYAQSFIALAAATKEAFQREKLKGEFLDFSDMEQFASRLLDEKDIAKELQEKYETILVDEFQDTNALQERILQKMARKDNVFRVGDLKQSIYGFRQARPELMKHLMESEAENPDLKVIYLSDNYRSSPDLVYFNNKLHGALMNLEVMESQFHKEDEARAAREKKQRTESAERPVRFLYNEYKDYINPETNKPDIRTGKSLYRENRYEILAQDIARRIEREKSLPEAQRISYRDIAILTRYSTNHDKIAKALEAYGIKSLRRYKKGFYTNQAVLTILSAMQAIQNPYDDIALMAALCSPLGRVSQEQIAKAVNESKEEKTGSLYEVLRLAPFMKEFKKMQAFKDLPIAKMLLKLYGFHDFYMLYTNNQDKTNLDLLLQKGIEAQQFMDVDTFLKQSHLDADLNKTGEAAGFGKDSDAVRISTIHGSKGLQYKTVYLLMENSYRDRNTGPVFIDEELGLGLSYLDPGRRFRQSSAKELAFKSKLHWDTVKENMRQFYVATTRAEDNLIFVDSIRDLEDYHQKLGLGELLKHNEFTPWLVSVAFDHPEVMSLIHYEPKELIDPKPLKKEKKTFRLKAYSRPKGFYSSQIAARVEKGKWKPIAPKAPSKEPLKRGTLFHKMVSTLGYPYKEEEIVQAFKDMDLECSPADIEQMQALNENETYQKWLKKEHAYEYPFVSQEENGNILHGFIDLIVFDQNAIDIIDFKTDHTTPLALIEEYKDQLAVYKKAMESIYPQKKLRLHLYSFFNEAFIDLDEKELG